MTKEERVRYYADKTEWLADNCERYTQAARQAASVGGAGRAALEENWRLWQEALGEEEFGEESDRPTTVRGMLRELSAIMHPNVQEFPWRDETVQGRREKFREHQREKERRARREAEGARFPLSVSCHCVRACVRLTTCPWPTCLCARACWTHHVPLAYLPVYARVLDSPRALGLLDALPGADRVHAQDRRGQRPY